MRKLTEEEALTIMCPKSFNKEWILNCKGSKCFAWEETDSRIEREDHSGGKEIILKARGTCRLIYPETERKEKEYETK